MATGIIRQFKNVLGTKFFYPVTTTDAVRDTTSQKTVKTLFSEVDSTLGSTSISSIGDGTVSGAINTINSNLSNLQNVSITGVNCSTGSITVPSTWKNIEIQVLVDGSVRLFTMPLKRGLISSNKYTMRQGYYFNSGNYIYIDMAVKFNSDGTLTITNSSCNLSGSDVRANSQFGVVYTN